MEKRYTVHVHVHWRCYSEILGPFCFFTALFCFFCRKSAGQAMAMLSSAYTLSSSLPDLKAKVNNFWDTLLNSFLPHPLLPFSYSHTLSLFCLPLAPHFLLDPTVCISLSTLISIPYRVIAKLLSRILCWAFLYKQCLPTMGQWLLLLSEDARPDPGQQWKSLPEPVEGTQKDHSKLSLVMRTEEAVQSKVCVWP